MGQPVSLPGRKAGVLISQLIGYQRTSGGRGTGVFSKKFL
jgi:hypothetical protein